MEDIFDQDDFLEFFSSKPSPENVLKFVNKRISSCLSVVINEPFVIKLIFKEIIGVDDDVNLHVARAIESLKRIVTRELEELMNKGIFKKELDPGITASMIMGGVMLIVYEYEKKGLDFLNEDVINAIANQYLHGAMN
jgi:hypothetical protein